MRTNKALCFIVGIFIFSTASKGQAPQDVCSVQLVRLQFDADFKLNGDQLNDRMLLLATKTDSILLQDSDIRSFAILTDTIIFYATIFLTSHKLEMKNEAAARIEKLKIPLCCGIPVALKLNNKEIYRAMLWNNVSQFGNKTVTIRLEKNSLVVTNGIQNLLLSKKSELSCLLHR